MKKAIYLLILSTLSTAANAMLTRKQETKDTGTWIHYHYASGSLSHHASRCIEGSSKGVEHLNTFESNYTTKCFVGMIKLNPQFTFGQLEDLYNKQQAQKESNPQTTND